MAHSYNLAAIYKTVTCPCPLKLMQKALIVFVKQTNIVDAVFQHRDALDSHAKCEPIHLFRIVADHFQHFRMHHARSEYFNPTFVGTHSATVTVAHHARYVHFCTRFGKWKVAWPKTYTTLFTEKGTCKFRQNTF